MATSSGAQAALKSDQISFSGKSEGLDTFKERLKGAARNFSVKHVAGLQDTYQSPPEFILETIDLQNNFPFVPIGNVERAQ